MADCCLRRHFAFDLVIYFIVDWSRAKLALENLIRRVRR